MIRGARGGTPSLSFWIVIANKWSYNSDIFCATTTYSSKKVRCMNYMMLPAVKCMAAYAHVQRNYWEVLYLRLYHSCLWSFNYSPICTVHLTLFLIPDYQRIASFGLMFEQGRSGQTDLAFNFPWHEDFFRLPLLSRFILSLLVFESFQKPGVNNKTKQR